MKNQNKPYYTDESLLPDYSSAYFADGGGISIDPSKRGTFKAQASRMDMSVQEAASAILNAPEGKYSPEMRKKANFAKNFAKQQGGEQQDQMMQLIQMYAQIAQLDPNELVKKLQSMQPQEQQVAIEQMSQAVEQAMAQQQQEPQMKDGGEMIKRADGSYSKRGLWDNIRANKGSGKEPTKEMLEQENRIKKEMQIGGGIMSLGSDTPYIASAYANALGNAPMFDPINALVGYTGLADALIGSAKGYSQLFNFLGNPTDKAKQNGISQKQNDINKDRAEQFRIDKAIKNSPTYDDVNFKPYQFDDTAYARFGGSYLPFAQTGKFIKPDIYDQDPMGIDTSMFQKPKTDAQLQAEYSSITGDDNVEPVSNLKQSTINSTKQTRNRFDANTALQGLAAFNNYLGIKDSRAQMREYNEMLRRLGNSNSRTSTNPVNPYGNYTLNVGPGQNFQLNRGVPSQDMGAYAKYGGNTKRNFKTGGEYQVSQEELIQLMKDGAEIEFL